MRRATLVDWFKQPQYREGRGWVKGTLRRYDEDVRRRVIAFKRQRIDRQKYFQGAPYVQMDYAKRYPKQQLPSLWFIGECVRQAGLQTHAPRKRPKGHDTVRQRRFPIKTIVGLGRIHQACDFVGKKYIHGSPEAISIFSTSYYLMVRNLPNMAYLGRNGGAGGRPAVRSGPTIRSRRCCVSTTP